MDLIADQIAHRFGGAASSQVDSLFGADSVLRTEVICKYEVARISLRVVLDGSR